MRLDALLKGGAGKHLLTSGDAGMTGTSSQLGALLKSVLSPLLPVARWWLRELKDMVPQKLRQLVSERRLLVRASQHELCLTDMNSNGGGETCYALRLQEDPATASAAVQAARRCDLLLDTSLVLKRELELPLDAEANLRGVLSFSLDRYTPFNENDVLFDFSITHRDSANRKISLNLYVAPLDGLNPILRQLAEMGIEPVAIDVAAATEYGREGINLLPAQRRRALPDRGRSNTVLAFITLALLLIVVVFPFVMRQQAVKNLQGEVSRLREQVRQVEADRNELDKRIERMRLIHERSSTMPAVLDILLELTRLMPDDAWASQVSIKSGRVRLSGEANAASDLLARLSTSSLFSDPKFESPLTQNPRTGRERFAISLAIKGYNYDA